LAQAAQLPSHCSSPALASRIRPMPCSPSAIPEAAATGAVTKGGAAASAQLEEAEAKIRELVDLEDYYFGADKEAKQQKVASAALALAQEAASAAKNKKGQQDLGARACCVQGQALAFLPGQEAQAEDLLSRALKLSPKLVEGWNALGEVYWNQQSYTKAKDAFEQALELCGPNATSLRNLSMVLRALEGDDEERAANYMAGVQKAKEATVLDAQDPLSWETLGNAYMGEFFVNGKKADSLNRALIAYGRAETMYEKLGKRNPTLHMNRGMAAKFLEDYDLALRSFRAAREIGAAKAGETEEGVQEFLERISGLLKRKGDLKAKRLKQVVGLTAAGPGQARCCRLEELAKGEKVTGPLAATVISLVDRGDDIPVVLVCCDAAGDFFALSLYNAEASKVAEAIVPSVTAIEVSEPHYRYISATVRGKDMSYPCIRVPHPSDIAVVGGGSLGGAAVRSVFTSGKVASSTAKKGRAALGSA